VINTAGGARLVLNGTKTGAINGITVTQTGGDGGLAQLAYDPLNSNTQLTQSQAPQDAQFTINGFAASSPSNAVSGVITGVTINLLKATAVNTPTTLTVGYDQEGATSAITNFVTAYNALITSVKALTSYDVATKTAGTLLGNTTVTSLVSKLRQLLSTQITSSTGGVQSLTDLGVTASLQGTLDQSDSKVGAALTSNLTSVTNLLGGKNGLAAQLDSTLTQYTQPSGLLDTISKGLSSGLADISHKQTALQLRLATYSATLTKQFNAMDAAVASLKQTQNFLTQAFNSINGTKTSTNSN
jgi:flagellar hook-associated protein 2